MIKRALVTGATSGVGESVARLLAFKGIHLILAGRNESKLESLREELSILVEVKTISGDLENPQDRLVLIDLMKELQPDLLINNAGFGLYGEVLNSPTKEQLSILEVNGMVVMELTIEMAKMVVSQHKPGIIVNISSVAGFIVFPLSAVYAASKAFVTHLSQSLDFELRSKGVRVLAFCPGMIDTAFQERAGGERNEKESLGVMTPQFVAEKIWNQIEKLSPLVIVDWKYRLLLILSKIIPNKWIASIQASTIAKRIK